MREQAYIDNAVVFALTIRRPGLTRKGNLDDITTDADKRRLHLTKRILNSPEFNAIANWDRQLIQLVHSRTLPFPFKRGHGLYLLPIDLIDWMEQAVAMFLPARQVLIDAFITAYPARVNEDREALGSQFSRDDYPTTALLNGAFGIDIQMVELCAPEALRERSPALYAREEGRLAEQMTEAGELAYDQLKTELTQLISTDEGKPKAVRAAMLKNLDDWLGVFEARNLFGAEDLAALVGRIRAVLQDIQPEDIAGQPALAKTIQDGLAEVAQAVTALPPRVGARTPRKIRLDELETTAAD